MRRRPGSQRQELSPAHIDDITRIFGEFPEVPERGGIAPQPGAQGRAFVAVDEQLAAALGPVQTGGQPVCDLGEAVLDLVAEDLAHGPHRDSSPARRQTLIGHTGIERSAHALSVKSKGCKLD